MELTTLTIFPWFFLMDSSVVASLIEFERGRFSVPFLNVTFLKQLFHSSSDIAWKVLESLLPRLSLIASCGLLTAVLSEFDSLTAVVAETWVLGVSLGTKIIGSDMSGGRVGGDPELISSGLVIRNALIPLKTCDFVRKIKRGKKLACCCLEVQQLILGSTTADPDLVF